MIMKYSKINILFLLSIVCATLTAQEAAIPTKKIQERLVIELTTSNWDIQSDSAGFETEWFSNGISVYGHYALPLGSKESALSLDAGLGFSFNNVYHNASLVDDSSGLQFQEINSTTFADNYSGNRFTTTYLEIPLELKFITKANEKGHRFKVGSRS